MIIQETRNPWGTHDWQSGKSQFPWVHNQHQVLKKRSVKEEEHIIQNTNNVGILEYFFMFKRPSWRDDRSIPDCATDSSINDRKFTNVAAQKKKFLKEKETLIQHLSIAVHLFFLNHWTKANGFPSVFASTKCSVLDYLNLLICQHMQNGVDRIIDWLI